MQAAALAQVWVMEPGLILVAGNLRVRCCHGSLGEPTGPAAQCLTCSASYNMVYIYIL